MISASLPIIAAGEVTPAALSLHSVLLGLFALGLAYALLAIAALRRRVDELTAAREQPAPPPAPAAPASPAPDEISPELLTVIAAAVHATLGDLPHRIVSLTAADQRHADQRAAWSAEGRRDVFLSHRIR